MAVSFHNSSLTCPLSSPSTLSSLQCPASWNDREVTVLPGSRLTQDSSGSIFLIAKSPFEVVGERILRPLIERVSTLASSIFPYIQFLQFRSSAQPVEMRLRSVEVPLSQEERLYRCLANDPLTATYNGFNRAFAEHFANKKLEDLNDRSLFKSVIDGLKKEYELHPALWGAVEEFYEITLKKCLPSMQNN